MQNSQLQNQEENSQTKFADAKFFFHLYSHKIFFWFFILFFVLQIMLWRATEGIKPNFDLVPPAPNKYVVSATSLGDKEFLFRVLGARLQNSGDVFAGFVALNKYDYSRIYNWFKSLDELNSQSHFVPSLASYYYAQTQNKPDTKYIVDYLDEHSSADIDKNWWWIFQAIYIAKNNMRDLDRALELAYKLSKNKAKDAPLWTREMPAFIHSEMGDDCMAFRIVEKVAKEMESGKRQASVEEIDFMRHFIKRHLDNLKKKRFDPRKCAKI